MKLKESQHKNARRHAEAGILGHFCPTFKARTMSPNCKSIPVLAAIVAVAVSCTNLSAADWSDGVFPVKAHDFGTCAVGAKTEFRFPVTNTFSQDLHIVAVRASCGCTTPIIENNYVQPGQTGSILARFNTGTFKGKKHATLTVVIDQPFVAEAKLHVDGYIRSDIVFHPGEIQFGTINQGTAATSSTRVLYAGRDTWEITNVRASQPWLQPSAQLVSRGGGRVEYKLNVAVREDAPDGYFYDTLIVTTNDVNRPTVPLRVVGNVESKLKVSPQAISLGRLKPGQSINKRLVLKGRTPFTVGSIKVAGWDVAFTPTNVAKTTHLLNVSLTPTDATGAQRIPIEITTSGSEVITAKALLTADIREE